MAEYSHVLYPDLCLGNLWEARFPLRKETLLESAKGGVSGPARLQHEAPEGEVREPPTTDRGGSLSGSAPAVILGRPSFWL